MIGARINQRGEYAMRRDERPVRRKNPSGEVVFVARWTAGDGKRRSAGTFKKAGPCRAPADGCCAQHAIWTAYEAEKAGTARHQQRGTVGDYAARWLEFHPRSERSNATHEGRLRAVLPLDLGDGPLERMLFADVERRHAVQLVDTFLRGGIAVNTVKSRLSTLAAMWMDALDDGWTKTTCPFLQLRVRHSDPRAQKGKREATVLSWAEMHAIAAAAGRHEPMIRLLSDCGLRIGEMLPLRRMDVKLGAGACDEAPRCRAEGPHVHVRRKAWEGRVYDGTKTRNRIAPVPPVLAGMLGRVMPISQDGLMFPTSTGHVMHDRDFRQRIFRPACDAVGVSAIPHDLRHGWVSEVRAAGVDVADAAEAAGHSVLTATRIYAHPMGRSHEQMRAAVPE